MERLQRQLGIRDSVEINIDGDSIDLEMRITENRQATLNRVRIAGNDRVY